MKDIQLPPTENLLGIPSSNNGTPILANVVTKMLPVTLEKEEWDDFSKDLAEQAINLENLTNEAKESAASYKDPIKVKKENVLRIAKVVESGEEERQVKCEWVMHLPLKGMKQLIRLDTNEVISEKAMTNTDKEQHFASLQMQAF